MENILLRDRNLAGVRAIYYNGETIYDSKEKELNKINMGEDRAFERQDTALNSTAGNCK